MFIFCPASFPDKLSRRLDEIANGILTVLANFLVSFSSLSQVVFGVFVFLGLLSDAQFVYDTVN